MPASMVRKSIWLVAILAIAALFVVLTLPIIASTQIVRDSVAQQVSAWSGYRVRLDDAPEIQVWPTFKAVLNDVTLSDLRDARRPQVMQAERVEIDLSALAALRGMVVFTKIRLVRPVVYVNKVGLALQSQTLPKWGRLARAIELARELLASDQANPDISALPDDPFAMIEVEDGSIVTNQANAEGTIASSLTGRLTWPALNRPANLSASGIWRGEKVEVKAETARPLFLLAGGEAPLSFALSSAPLAITFKGTADIADSTFVDGQVEATAPSMERLLEWSMLTDWPKSMIKAVTLKSDINGDATRIKFEKAQISLDNNSASGVFDIAFTQPQPTVTGTLAFESLDLRSMLATLAPDPTTDLPLKSPLSHKANLDLRMSAASATAGRITLKNVAATAQVNEGLVSLDISDATTLGGTVQMGLRLDQGSTREQAEFRLTAHNIDGKALASGLEASRLIPQAQGSFSAFIKGRGNNLASILETADGSITASFGKGEIPGLNLQAFYELNKTGGFFPFASISDGTLAIEKANLKATLSGGVAWIDKAEISSGAQEISLGGLVPIAGRGLALSGSITPVLPPDENGPQPQETFFVGGSWKAPFIAPFSTN